MITAKFFKDVYLASGSCRPEETSSAFFAAAWPEVRDGLLTLRKVSLEDDRFDIFLYNENEKDLYTGEPMSTTEFFNLHYKMVRTAVMEGRVWVLNGEQPRFIHRSAADVDDLLNKMDLYDALSVLRELRERYNNE